MRRLFVGVLSLAIMAGLSIVPTNAAPRPFCERKPEHWKCQPTSPSSTPLPATPSPSLVPSLTPSPTPSPTVAPTPTNMPSPSVTPSPTATATPLPDGEWRLLFHDDFYTDIAEGAFPADGSWSAYPHGWPDTSGNGTYDPGIVSVHDGLLDKHLHYADGEYKVANLSPRWPDGSGGMTGYQLYGRYEVRFRADPVDGYKTAWLLWPNDGEGGNGQWPRDGEIDFPEGSLDGTICAFMHRQDATSGSDQDAFCTDETYTDWHTAVIEWEPERIGFYLDGVLIGESTDRIPNTPMRWQLQTETELSSTPPPTSAAGHVYIDRVSAWAYAP